MSGLSAANSAEYKMAGLIIKWVLSNLKTIFIGAVIAFVLGLYPAGYVNGNAKGKAYVQSQWDAANVSAIKRGNDARKAAEAEVAATPTPVVAPPPVPAVAPAKGAKPAATHAVPPSRGKPVPGRVPNPQRDPYDRG